MLKDFFDQYDEANSAYKEKLKQLDKMKHFTKTNMGIKYATDTEIYNLRGTRYFLMIKKEYWPLGIGDFVNLKLRWILKSKNKKEYKTINLEEVLDSSLISDGAKEEIVFNLNVFLAPS